MATTLSIPTWIFKDSLLDDYLNDTVVVDTDPYGIIQAIAYGIIGSITILASLAVTAIIIQNLRMKRNQDFLSGEHQKLSNMIMISMFVADIVFSIGYIFPRFVIHGLYSNPIYCNLVTTIAPTIITIINFSLMAISIDTLDCIIHPFRLRFRSNSKTIGLLISIIIWVTSIVIGIMPFLANFRFIHDDICMPINIDGFEKERLYFLAVIGISFVTPLIVMIYCYTRIFIQIRSRQFTDHVKRKTAKVLTVLVTTYFLMWSPFVVCLTINAIYEPVQLAQTFPYFRTAVIICQLIAFSYPAINPLLYGYYVPSVRRFMVQIENRMRFMFCSSRQRGS